MPTDITSRFGLAASRASDLTEARQSEDLTVLLLLTATGLAIALGFMAFGLLSDVWQNVDMFG